MNPRIIRLFCCNPRHGEDKLGQPRMRQLGTYEAWIEDGRVDRLVPKRLPKGMTFVGPGQPKPSGPFFAHEIRGGEPTVANARHGIVAAYGGLLKFRWRCWCGAAPVLSASQLVKDIARHGERICVT